VTGSSDVCSSDLVPPDVVPRFGDAAGKLLRRIHIVASIAEENARQTVSPEETAYLRPSALTCKRAMATITKEWTPSVLL